jgi:hypothetical protein
MTNSEFNVKDRLRSPPPSFKDRGVVDNTSISLADICATVLNHHIELPARSQSDSLTSPSRDTLSPVALKAYFILQVYNKFQHLRVNGRTVQ